ncbi:hypothetical protein GH714_026787 [Hevea brasiliensis]|uniref:Uncharacterized protein n=1 Tax=Hevea brasiliensis TaxID=3981 RepID=A0A6A6M529_HEVBR|nr:hypothetical protein GH714_026787 [Hevea brasiliensis]
MPDGRCKIIGEISASRLWECDYLAAVWALANLSAGQFVMGADDNLTTRSFPGFTVNSTNGENNMFNDGGSTRARKFSSRSIGFNPGSSSFGIGRSMATHVWVTEDSGDDVLVGMVGYADILIAVTKPPSSFIPVNRSSEGFAAEVLS